MSSSPENNPTPVALRDVYEVIRAQRWLFIQMVSVATAPFLVQLVFHVGPPWPHATGIAMFTSIAMFIGLVGAYVAFDFRSKEKYKGRVKLWVLCSCIAFVVYGALFTFFTREAPTSSNRVAAGFIVREIVSEALIDDPSTTVTKLLGEAEYDPLSIWVEWTVFTTRFLLLLLWSTAAACLVCLFTALVKHEEHASRYRRRQKTEGA